MCAPSHLTWTSKIWKKWRSAETRGLVSELGLSRHLQNCLGPGCGYSQGLVGACRLQNTPSVTQASSGCSAHLFPGGPKWAREWGYSTIAIKAKSMELWSRYRPLGSLPSPLSLQDHI